MKKTEDIQTQEELLKEIQEFFNNPKRTEKETKRLYERLKKFDKERNEKLCKEILGESYKK